MVISTIWIWYKNTCVATILSLISLDCSLVPNFHDIPIWGHFHESLEFNGQQIWTYVVQVFTAYAASHVASHWLDLFIYVSASPLGSYLSIFPCNLVHSSYNSAIICPKNLSLAAVNVQFLDNYIPCRCQRTTPTYMATYLEAEKSSPNTEQPVPHCCHTCTASAPTQSLTLSFHYMWFRIECLLRSSSELHPIWLDEASNSIPSHKCLMLVTSPMPAYPHFSSPSSPRVYPSSKLHHLPPSKCLWSLSLSHHWKWKGLHGSIGERARGIVSSYIAVCWWPSHSQGHTHCSLNGPGDCSDHWFHCLPFNQHPRPWKIYYLAHLNSGVSGHQGRSSDW